MQIFTGSNYTSPECESEQHASYHHGLHIFEDINLAKVWVALFVLQWIQKSIWMKQMKNKLLPRRIDC